MSVAERIDRESVHEALTPEMAADLLFHSYRYSQGNGSLQQALFTLIHRLRPHWTLTPEARSALASENFLKRIRAYVNSSTHSLGKARNVTQNDINVSIMEETKAFTRIIRNGIVQEEHRNPHKLCAHIIFEIVRKDARFMEMGRKQSQFISYVLGIDTPPGPPVFKEVFGTLRYALKTLKPAYLRRYLKVKDKSMVDIDPATHLAINISKIVSIYNQAPNRSSEINIKDYLSPEMAKLIC